MLSNVIGGYRRRSQPQASHPAPRAAPPPPPSIPFSEFSSHLASHSHYACENFMIGAGLVIFQRNTRKVVVVQDSIDKDWFFPKGRKDIGESVEQAALREGFEESGYRADFLPLYSPTRAPPPPHALGAHLEPNCEPFHLSITPYGGVGRGNRILRPPGVYVVFWYLGIIDEDAVHHTGTGMPDEQNYKSHLMSEQEAFNVLPHGQKEILAHAVYSLDYHFATLEVIRQEEQERANNRRPNSAPNPRAGSA